MVYTRIYVYVYVYVYVCAYVDGGVQLWLARALRGQFSLANAKPLTVDAGAPTPPIGFRVRVGHDSSTELQALVNIPRP